MTREMPVESVLVVGSANMDLVARVTKFPKPGETVLADDFAMYPGGKGANQAVCCAKLGGNVDFVAKMGDDIYRDKLLESLRHDGVKTDCVSFDKSISTGVAFILVDDSGQNEITVISGSNMKLVPANLEDHQNPFQRAKVVLLQLEIPIETVIKTLEIAKKSGAVTILNPAPARMLPDPLYQFVDILTPNETECEMLTGTKVVDEKTAEKAAAGLLQKGTRNVVVTMGARGALLVNNSVSRLYKSLHVKPIDTTAAGDAFNGALAFSMAAGKTLEESIHFANSVAALSITRKGAQASMPTMNELDEFLMKMEHQ